MKRASVIMLSFLAVGCTGLDKHAGDTFYPLSNPNAPDAQSETARRVRGEAVSNDPILPEEGDVWPGQPDPVPSLQDVSKSSSRFLDKWNQSRPRLDEDLKHQLSDGQGLSAGENVGKRYGSGKGVMPIGKPLPSHVHDNAPPYLEPVNRGTVSIPNGDGTVTLIAPDGSVKVVSQSKAPAFQKLKTFHHKQGGGERAAAGKAGHRKRMRKGQHSHTALHERVGKGGAVARKKHHRRHHRKHHVSARQSDGGQDGE